MSLELRGLTLRRGDVLAVDCLSYCFGAGKVTAILGPSGSGKSSLLSLVAGTLRPDAGGLYWDGQEITRTPPERRDFGMVFQHYALFPNMNVIQNVEFGLRVRRVPPDERRRAAAEALDRAHAPHLAARRVDQLSGGEQQRVALARAIAYKPRCLLMDEPLAALDASLRRTVRGELKALLSELGITTLFVTHDQAEAFEVGDVVMILNQGRIEQVGSPDDVNLKPATPFVADFLGLRPSSAPPMRVVR